MLAIFEFIEMYYNRKRTHSSLEYKSSLKSKKKPIKKSNQLVKKGPAFESTAPSAGEISNKIKGGTRMALKGE